MLRGAKSARAVLKARREQRSDFLGGRHRLRSAWFGLGPMIPEVSWCGKMASRAKELCVEMARGPNRQPKVPTSPLTAPNCLTGVPEAIPGPSLRPLARGESTLAQNHHPPARGYKIRITTIAASSRPLTPSSLRVRCPLRSMCRRTYLPVHFAGSCRVTSPRSGRFLSCESCPSLP